MSVEPHSQPEDDSLKREFVSFIDSGVERGGNRANFERLMAQLRQIPPSSQPLGVAVAELSRLIRSVSEKAAVDELIDSGRMELVSVRENIRTFEDGGRDCYEKASRLLALAYDGTGAPHAETRDELIDTYITDVLAVWLELHGTPKDQAAAALVDVRARLGSLARLWGTPAAHALLGAYRELADAHQPAELPAWTRQLALVGVRNSELETVHLDGHIHQEDWRVLTQAAAYALQGFDAVPLVTPNESDDLFAGIADASPGAAAAFAALFELGPGQTATWDASRVGQGRPFELEVVTVPLSPQGYDVMHAMDPRVPKRFVSEFLEGDESPELLVLPSFKHISRNPAKLFPVIEHALHHGMTIATNNCYLEPGLVRRRERCVQYNELDVGWCVKLADCRLTGAGLFQEVGRNDPCPCGSGRKYKRCCGQ